MSTGLWLPAQASGDDRLGRALALEHLFHESGRCRLVAGPDDAALQHLTLVIDRAPGIDDLAV